MTGYSADFKSPLGRLAYAPGIWTPRWNDEKTRQSFSCTLLFAKDSDLSALKAAAAEACKDEWPGKYEQWIKDGLIKSPLLDGDGSQGVNKTTGERHAGYAGHVFIRCSANVDRPPKIYNAALKAASQNASTVKEGPYSGCYVYAVLNAYTWENAKTGKGVSFGFSMVQAARDGEPLGRVAPSADKFLEKIEDAGAAPDEVKSGQGAAGLFA